MTNTNKLIEIAIANGAVLYESETPQIIYMTIHDLQAIIDAVNASQGEAIYQVWDMESGFWDDVDKEQYDLADDKRIVYLAPAQVNEANLSILSLRQIVAGERYKAMAFNTAEEAIRQEFEKFIRTTSEYPCDFKMIGADLYRQSWMNISFDGFKAGLDCRVRQILTRERKDDKR